MNERYFHLLWRDPALQARESELALAECCALTAGEPHNERIVISRRQGNVERAAFTAYSAQTIVRASSLTELLKEIGRHPVEAPQFKVIVKKIPPSLEPGSVHIQSMVGQLIDGYPDLRNPLTKLLLVYMPGELWFGRIVAESDFSWRERRRKAWQYSRSLPTSVARALINLAAEPGERLVDPCCGSGTIVMEAAEMGLDVHGYDINPKMVRATSTNLADRGFRAVVAVADATRVEGKWDVVVTDLPYGRYQGAVETEGNDMLLRAIVRLAPKVAVVTANPVEPELDAVDASYRRVIPLRVSRELVRHIHLLKR